MVADGTNYTSRIIGAKMIVLMVFAATILTAVIVAAYRFSQTTRHDWYFHNGMMRRELPDGSFETRPATEDEKEWEWWNRQW
jgi:hypothetical protein